MFFTPDRDQLRQFYCDVWQKHCQARPLEPLECLIRDVVLQHPEYQALLERDDVAKGKDYLPELGETNPFLHMGLHLALIEQISTDRPPGIRALARQLQHSGGDPHAQEHRMMDCLAEMIWRSQREARPPDEAAYLNCLRGLVSPSS